MASVVDIPDLDLEARIRAGYRAAHLSMIWGTVMCTVATSIGWITNSVPSLHWLIGTTVSGWIITTVAGVIGVFLFFRGWLLNDTIRNLQIVHSHYARDSEDSEEFQRQMRSEGIEAKIGASSSEDDQASSESDK